jgi:hypothetical protein
MCFERAIGGVLGVEEALWGWNGWLREIEWSEGERMVALYIGEKRA